MESESTVGGATEAALGSESGAGFVIEEETATALLEESTVGGIAKGGIVAAPRTEKTTTAAVAKPEGGAVCATGKTASALCF